MKHLDETNSYSESLVSTSTGRILSQYSLLHTLEKKKRQPVHTAAARTHTHSENTGTHTHIKPPSIVASITCTFRLSIFLYSPPSLPLPMLRIKQQEALFLQLCKSEHVVRLESERREAKGRLRVMDAMRDSLDDQLLYVAQFKKQWLQHHKLLEVARQDLAALELERRSRVEEDAAAALSTLLRRHQPNRHADDSMREL